jgi:hypothetical protein
MKLEAPNSTRTRTRFRSEAMDEGGLQLRTRKKAGFWVFILPSDAPRVTARQVKQLLKGWS